jgi:sporulation protein YlmC with PRC-barrel domain
MNMKTNNRIMAASIAVLCLALTLRARAGDPASDPLPFRDVEIRSDTKPGEGMPARFNRASGIIGMDVRNQAAEHLGRIKELVFDLQTERMSYAVISTRPKGIFTPSEKLLAVPSNALTASADGKHLILNAEKSKVKTAIGFKRDHWPAVDNPVWDVEPFWKDGANKSKMPHQSAGELAGH